MSFDYKDLSARLRQKFAGVADAADFLRRVDFEENIADRHGGQKPTINQRILKVLHENVPSATVEVMTVATMLSLPRGMVNEHRYLDSFSQETRDLYFTMTRNPNPAMAVTQSPEAAQMIMAMMVVNAEIMEDARKTSYVPYAHMQGLAQEMLVVKAMLSYGAQSGAAQLDKLFTDTADRIAQQASNFFHDHNKKPPHP